MQCANCLAQGGDFFQDGVVCVVEPAGGFEGGVREGLEGCAEVSVCCVSVCSCCEFAALCTFLGLRPFLLPALPPQVGAVAVVVLLGLHLRLSFATRHSPSLWDFVAGCGCDCGSASCPYFLVPASTDRQSSWEAAAQIARPLLHDVVWSYAGGARRDGGGVGATTCACADAVPGCWSRGRSSRVWTVGNHGRRHWGAEAASSLSAGKGCPYGHGVQVVVRAGVSAMGAGV